MKLRSLLPLAAFAALVLTGCSKDDVVAPNQEPTVTEGYATFKINLPSTPGSRAEDVADDAGNANEYKVNDITLLLFNVTTGGSEDDATFVKTVDLNSNAAEWKTTSENGITTEATVTAQIGTIVSGNDYYAVALVNAGTASNFAPATEGTKYSEWAKTLPASATYNIDPTNGFYMSSAVLSNGEKLTKMAKIDTGKMGKTAAEAQANGSAATIYVERIAAKVTVTNPTDSKANVGSNNDNVDLKGWVLDNTIKKGYPVKNVDGLAVEDLFATGEKFFGNAVSTSYYRTEWCKGAYYSTPDKATPDDFNFINVNSATFGTTAAQYCIENTLDETNMKKDRATRVVFKAEYKLNDNTEAAVTLVKLLNNVTIRTEAAFITFVTTRAKEALSSENVTVTSKNPNGGYLALSEVVTIEKDGTEVTEATDLNKVAAALGLNDASTDKGIAYYKDGVTYYAAYIQHILPLNESDTKLGKYSVVRNNWYALTVNSISSIGEPARPGTGTDPTDPDTPGDIDVEKSYIDVSINILKWAKRTQEVDL